MNHLALLASASPASALGLLDWLVIAGYFALLLGISWWVILKRKDTAEDYFLAGRNLGWFIAFRERPYEVTLSRPPCHRRRDRSGLLAEVPLGQMCCTYVRLLQTMCRCTSHSRQCRPRSLSDHPT